MTELTFFSNISSSWFCTSKKVAECGVQTFSEEAEEDFHLELASLSGSEGDSTASSLFFLLRLFFSSSSLERRERERERGEGGLLLFFLFSGAASEASAA